MMQTPMIYNSEQIGGNGGGEFNPKTAIPFSPNLRISQILIRAGNSIDSVQFIMTDGMNTYTMEKIGGNGGKPYDFVVPQGQYITEITVYSQPYLEGLQFKTSGGLVSPLFGRTRDKKTVIPINGNLLAYGGRAGSLIDAIQFFWWA